MLSKLIKYDMRATTRLLLPINIGFVAVSLLCSLGVGAFTSAVIRDDVPLWETRWLSLLLILSVITWVLALFAVLFVSQGYSVVHFYRNLLGNEGYLMHTLPVTTKALVGSKLIVATIWTLISTIVTTCGCLLMGIGGTLPLIISKDLPFAEFMGGLREELVMLATRIGTPLWVLFVETAVLFILGTAFTMLSYYLAIAIGQLIAPKHRILASVGMYLAINFAAQSIYGIFTLVGGIFGFADATIGGLTVSTFTQLALISGIVLTAGIGVVMYFITTGCFKKRINLQ